LAYLLRDYQENHRSGKVVDGTLSEQEIKVGDNRRRADRAIWIGLGRKPKPAKDTPTIAIELVCRSARHQRRDYQQKRSEYAKAGVKEYRVIDRFARTMIVFRGKGKAQVINEVDVYSTPLMPGFELPLARVLEEAYADAYADD